MAEWIERVDETHYCSNCWYDALFDREDKLEYLSEYCPHCGSPMTKRIPYEGDAVDNGLD